MSRVPLVWQTARMESWTLIVGIALAAAALLQFALWTTASIRRLQFDRRQFEWNQQILRRQLDQIDNETRAVGAHAWNGYRKFFIASLRRECRDCLTVRLIPEDGRPLPFFFPGQHVTLRLAIPNHVQPVVRCYSLSSAPHAEHLQITVRDVGGSASDGGARPAAVSSFIHRRLAVGDRIDVKAPAGDFYLDVNDRRPVVLLAGGIGITPFMSMIETLVQHRIPRDVLLLYGVRNGEHHAFRQRLAEVALEFPRIHVVTCYSQPLPSDKLGTNFQVAGRVSIELIRRLVPHPQVPFYLCGPPRFLSDLRSVLLQWGVPESCIHREAFGPASVRAATTPSPESAGANPTTISQIHFHKSNKKAPWNGEADSLLTVADQAGVSIASGCRAGNCGTCQTRLISGQVNYVGGIDQPDCEPGHVLPCVSIPAGDVVLDA